jgi:hypothetical protein
VRKKNVTCLFAKDVIQSQTTRSMLLCVMKRISACSRCIDKSIIAKQRTLDPETYRIVTGTDCTGMIAASQMTHVTSSGRVTSYRRFSAPRLAFGGVKD